MKVGEAFRVEAERLDPSRPTILNSCDDKDPERSGDGHYYLGCLGGGSYLDIHQIKPKMLSEFGADVPPSAESLRSAPELARRLAPLNREIPNLHSYQYRLLKYQIEYVRIMKYAPCAGFFQFMWIDLCPESFYGV
jgi:beta-mannosidase